MTPEHVISQLLNADAKYPQNNDLLKKIILTAQLGRLQINGLPPDNRISLANYLFDNENMMFDFTHLSPAKQELFLQWLLSAHQKEKLKAYATGAYVNEYRGFTAETSLSWWGIIKNWLQKKYCEYWKIADRAASLNYQLTGIELYHGRKGLLVCFEQFLAPSSKAKYRDPNDSQNPPLRNTKRVLLTDHLVDRLIGTDFKVLDFPALCKKPHPQSVEVKDEAARHAQMYDYRRTQSFLALKPWYVRFFQWLFPWFREKPSRTNKSAVQSKLTTLYQDQKVSIKQFPKTHEVLVTEIRPDIDNVVYCGGGAKIFGHVGFWKALNEAKIKPSKFAGSSAGAIMALLCYLGYNAEEISEFFKNFKKEHLVHFDININGMSDPHSLKTALDFAIAYKLKEITSRYNIPYPQGEITFAVLESIRQQYPDCGLGKELIVTATNINTSTSRYFSLEHSPEFEISEAVKISASMPVVYRSTSVNGNKYNDGGVLNNFPTNVFCDDHSTLLESVYGNNLKVLAAQFDNGTERKAVDNLLDKVYKEHFFLNWLYKLLTGVNDPASGWEQDRLKLRQYSSQTIVINVDNISSSSFNVDERSREQMVSAGYNATKDYLKARFIINENGDYQNDELIHTKFASLGDLLSYCCYRGNYLWFNRVKELINQSHVPNQWDLLAQAQELEGLYFQDVAEKKEILDVELKKERYEPTFFGNEPSKQILAVPNSGKPNILLAVYPVFLKLSSRLVRDKMDKKILEKARHALSLGSPFNCLKHFAQIKKPMNVMLHIVISLLKELQDNPQEKLYHYFAEAHDIFNNNNAIYNAEYYAHWDLSLEQSLRLLHTLNTASPAEARKLLISLSKRAEPMQNVISGVFHDDYTFEESPVDDPGLVRVNF